jgi:Fic family protein
MDIESLGRSPIGSLVPVLGPDPSSHQMVQGHAFLPARLPQELALSTPTWNKVSAAIAALARLDGSARRIPNPALLRRPTLRREAQSTSALEGTYAPFTDVLAADHQDKHHMSAELVEVLNFEEMAELAFSWPEERSLTLGMLGELQSTLVRGTASELADSGGLRDRIVVIGSPGRPLDEARFVPPPPGDQLRAEVEALLGWVAEPPDLPHVVLAALTHYQFETLHPYSDGNGRLGRLLVIMQLLRGALIREPLLVVSPWFELRRAQYQDELLALSCDGEWDRWVAFFAEGILASASASQQKVEDLVELQERLRETVQKAGKRGAAERLAADLVGTPYVTGRDVAARYDLSRPGALFAITTLVELGILSDTGATDSRGGHIHVAPEVVRIVSS